MNEKELKGLMEDPDFKKEIFKTKTPEEFKTLFSKKGINVTDKDVEQILNAMAPLIKTIETTEIGDPKIPTPIALPDNDTSNVVGGIDASSAAIGAGIVAGLIGAGGGAFAAYLKGKKDGKEEMKELLDWYRLFVKPSTPSTPAKSTSRISRTLRNISR